MSKYYEQFVNGDENPKTAGFSSKYEYCMVFELEKSGDVDPVTEKPIWNQSKFCKSVITLLLQQGLELFMYLSAQNDEVYVLITASELLLRKYAEKTQFKLLLSEADCSRLMEKGNEAEEIAPVKIKHDPTITPIPPFMYLFGKFETKCDQSVYYVNPDEKSSFSKEVRRKLIYYMIQGPLRDGGCDIEIAKMILSKKMTAFFPLHNSQELVKLSDKCREWSTMPWSQPFDELKTYFGEKFALYNAFLGHFTFLLIIPAIVGIVFQIIVFQDKNSYTSTVCTKDDTTCSDSKCDYTCEDTNVSVPNWSNPVMPFYAIIICFWSVSMLETWKGKQAEHDLKWGMIGFETDEPDRPEFLGIPSVSHIDGKPIVFFPKSEYIKRFSISALSVVAFILLVVVVVAAIYTIRYSMQKNGDNETGASTLASVLNAVQVTLFNIIYQKIVNFLTDLENHRTDTQYEDSMIAKLFAFQFVNSYASFFYLAFMAPFLDNVSKTYPDYLGQCGAINCMQPMAMNLGIVFGTRLLVTNSLELLFPLMSYVDKYDKEREGTDGKKFSPPEIDFVKVEYDQMQMSIKNYADTAIQFGYMCLFVAALPMAAVFSIISNYVKLRISAINMTRFFQRPVPVGAEDIGSWQGIFTILSVISVITNAAIVVFTMDVKGLFENSFSFKMWFFIIFQWVLIGFQFLIMNSIPDLPEYITIQQKRNEFVVSKLISLSPDDDFNKEFGDVLTDEQAEATRGSVSRQSNIQSKLEKSAERICCCLLQPLEKKPKVRETTDVNYPVQAYPEDESTSVRAMDIGDIILTESAKKAQSSKKEKLQKKGDKKNGGKKGKKGGKKDDDDNDDDDSSFSSGGTGTQSLDV